MPTYREIIDFRSECQNDCLVDVHLKIEWQSNLGSIRDGFKNIKYLNKELVTHCRLTINLLIANYSQTELTTEITARELATKLEKNIIDDFWSGVSVKVIGLSFNY